MRVATLPFGSVIADAPKSKNAKVTLVYQHELPNFLGKSIKSVLVEYGPGGYSPGHTHPKSAFIYATVLEGAIRSQVNDGSVMTYQTGQSFSELPGDRHTVSTNASNTKPAKASRGVRGGHERDGIDDPIRELRFNAFHAETFAAALCLLLAQSGHHDDAQQCPLLGVKRTSCEDAPMSAFDPKRT